MKQIFDRQNLWFSPSPSLEKGHNVNLTPTMSSETFLRSTRNETESLEFNEGIVGVCMSTKFPSMRIELALIETIERTLRTIENSTSMRDLLMLKQPSRISRKIITPDMVAMQTVIFMLHTSVYAESFGSFEYNTAFVAFELSFRVLDGNMSVHAEATVCGKSTISMDTRELHVFMRIAMLLKCSDIVRRKTAVVDGTPVLRI